MAATPETVKRLVKEGFAVEVAAGAGEAASFADGDYQAAGATLAAGGAGSATWPPADLVLKVAPPTPERGARAARRLAADLLPRAAQEPRRRAGARRAARQRARHGADPAHQPRADDGRALVAGQHRRLQGGAARRGAPRQVLPAADDGGRHHPPGQGGDHGRRRRRPAGDRDRAAARRAWSRSPTSAPRSRSRCSRSARKFIELPMQESGEGAGGYAKRDERGLPAQAARDRRPPRRRRRRGDHHRAGARASARRCWSPRDMVKGMRRGAVVVDLAADSRRQLRAVPARRRGQPRTACTILGYTNLPASMPEDAEHPVRAQRARAAAVDLQGRA